MHQLRSFDDSESSALAQPSWAVSAATSSFSPSASATATESRGASEAPAVASGTFPLVPAPFPLAAVDSEPSQRSGSAMARRPARAYDALSGKNSRIALPCSRATARVRHRMVCAADVRTRQMKQACVHCTALHCTALHCTAQHCTAQHCTAQHCTALPKESAIRDSRCTEESIRSALAAAFVVRSAPAALVGAAAVDRMHAAAAMSAGGQAAGSARRKTRQ